MKKIFLFICLIFLTGCFYTAEKNTADNTDKILEDIKEQRLQAFEKQVLDNKIPAAFESSAVKIINMTYNSYVHYAIYNLDDKFHLYTVSLESCETIAGEECVVSINFDDNMGVEANQIVVVGMALVKKYNGTSILNFNIKDELGNENPISLRVETQ